MALTLELTTEQFMTLYGDEDFIKGYSREAIEAILAYIGDDQQQWGTTSISWELLFEKSCELNAATIANSNDNNECLQDMATDVLEMACSTLIGMSSEAYEQLVDQDTTDDVELLIKLLPDFRKTNNWNENAAKLIAKAKGYTALNNGNYLMLAV